MFSEEWKYVIKEKKIHNYITDDVEISSDSDEDTLLEKNIWVWRKFWWRNFEKNLDGKNFWWKRFYKENVDEENLSIYKND